MKSLHRVFSWQDPVCSLCSCADTYYSHQICTECLVSMEQRAAPGTLEVLCGCLVESGIVLKGTIVSVAVRQLESVSNMTFSCVDKRCNQGKHCGEAEIQANTRTERPEVR